VSNPPAHPVPQALQDHSGLNMVQIEYADHTDQIQQSAFSFSSFVLLQPAGNQHLVSSGGGAIMLSHPGDHNFVSNSISAQPQAAQNQQLFNNFNTMQQVFRHGPFINSVPLISNTAPCADLSQYYGPSPVLTIIPNYPQNPPLLVNNLLQAGPCSPEPQSVPVELQTIPLLGDSHGHVPALQPPSQASVNTATNYTVNYLVQPADQNPSAPIVVEAARPHSEARDLRKSHHTKKGSFSEKTISILKSWLFRNITNPYPTDQEKKELLCLTGLTLSQLNNWLINSRRRMVKRLLSTLEGEHANFNSKASKGGTGGVNSRYANMWKNEGLYEQTEGGCESQEKSEEET